MSLLDFCKELKQNEEKKKTIVFEKTFQAAEAEGKTQTEALREAEMQSMKPKPLEKVKHLFGINVKSGLRNDVHFYFTDEELEIVKTKFNFNQRLMAIQNSELLIKMIEGKNGI